MEIFQDFGEDFKISGKISRSREDFKISLRFQDFPQDFKISQKDFKRFQRKRTRFQRVADPSTANKSLAKL